MRAVYRAGEFLKNGQDVILYDCGGDAVRLALSGLDGHFGLRPTALCDNDPAVWGKQLGGVSIISPHMAATRYPDAQWLVTNFLDRVTDIPFLTELGVAPEKIINYTAYERRTSCRYLENYLHPIDKSLSFCCDAVGRSTSPRIDAEDGTEIEETVFKGERLRQTTIEQLGNGTVCDHCGDMREAFYPKERKIQLLNYLSFRII